jgi:hypothetical protein
MNNIKIKKISQYWVGDAGPEMSGNADQDVEMPDEINDEEMIIDDRNPSQTPGEDNLVIDKMNSMITLLYKQGNIFAADLIKAALDDISKILISSKVR